MSRLGKMLVAPVPWVVNKLYREKRQRDPNLRLGHTLVNGEPQVPMVTAGKLKAIEAYGGFKPSDILIASYPKTGTTLTIGIVLKGTGAEAGFTEAIGARWLEGATCEGVPFDTIRNRVYFKLLKKLLPFTVKELKDLDPPTGRGVYKSHLRFHQLPISARKHSKLVYIVRDPKDVCISTYHFLKSNVIHNMQHTLEEYVPLFLKGRTIAGEIFSHYKSYLDAAKQQDNILIISYEEIVADKPAAIKKILDFCDLKATPELIEEIFLYTDIQRSRDRAAQSKAGQMLGLSQGFVRRGSPGGGKAELTEEMLRAIEEHARKFRDQIDDQHLYL